MIDFLHRITMRRFALACLFLLFALGVRGICAQTPQTPQAPTVSMRSGFGEKIQIKHVPNAGRISEHLYRGAQPKPGGLEQLQKLGITTIVDLRSEDSATRDREQKEAEALGIHFVSIPVGEFSPPTSDQVALFLSLFGEDSKETVFVHCQYGKDAPVSSSRRTVWAFGNGRLSKLSTRCISSVSGGAWHPEMISFVREFPSLLSSDPALQSLTPPKP